MNAAVVRRINAERHTHRKAPLVPSRVLRLSAQAKARELARSGELEHGFRWWRLVERFAGRRFARIGENIACGQQTPSEVVSAWMASPEHRANILGDYTHVGAGRADRDGRIYWVNHFGKV